MKDLDAALRALGYSSFRPGQREAVETLLAQRRVLLVAPTGGGKSLCYQLPALLLPGTTLVISPLIALMHDQVTALAARGVAASFLASTLPPEEIRDRLARLARGEYRLFYVAPERLGSTMFRDVLSRIDCPLLAVDEAHCISEWGHDFRPEYMQIGALLQSLPQARVLACTATATPIVRDEILGRLGLPPETPQLVRGFARPNLALRASEIGGARERATAVDAALAEALGKPRSGGGTAIVYAPTRRAAEEEADRLGKAGWRTAVYHAGLSADARDDAQRRFMDGALDLVCATNAFGMGIDRSDVRAVVHLGPPGSVEAYYQEVGRAGRDGGDALGLLCWSQQDLPLRRRLLEMPSGPLEVDPEMVEHKWNLFLELIRWAEGGSCRHDAILRYFGDEAETLHGCGRCDVCRRLDDADPAADADAAQLARKLLSGVARVHRRYGLKQAVRLLRGEAEERLERDGLTQVATFGALRERSPEWVARALGRCVTAGWVSFTGDERPMVVLTDDGRRVMRAERPARWLPPPELAAGTGKSGSRGKRAALATEGLDAAAQALFEALRGTRVELAREKGVPAYVIAHDRTLRELAEARPRNAQQLLDVPGFGPKKAEQFGAAFLRVIAAHAA
ncbi:MAG TPA: ATP-dependent DNA helicase RecQ [Verrucomicrobiae bacterium]|nr:ATP-dependent DNA helicase RecQ [Verrucomicrobiae bacterium]